MEVEVSLWICFLSGAKINGATVGATLYNEKAAMSNKGQMDMKTDWNVEEIQYVHWLNSPIETHEHNSNSKYQQTSPLLDTTTLRSQV